MAHLGEGARKLVGVVAALLAAIGFLLGSSPVYADAESCGSPFSSAAFRSAECQAAVDGRWLWIIVTGIAAIALAGWWWGEKHRARPDSEQEARPPEIS